MDERYGAFLYERMRQEEKKPPGERDPSVAEDYQRMSWWYRLQSGIPAESEAESVWRKSFDP